MTGALLLTGPVVVDAAGQTPYTPAEPLEISTRLAADLLRDLPAGANLFSILETTQPELIADRFNSGGLNAGDPARIAGFLASWSQTQYRLDDVNISSPTDGAPLLFPEVAFWDNVGITTGLMPADTNVPALAVSLSPRRPGSRWVRVLEVSAAGGGLVASLDERRAPPIIRLDQWTHGSVFASGPLIHPRVALAVGGSWTGNSTFVRAEPRRHQADVGSAFAHVVVTPTQEAEVRTVAWIQRARALADDVSAHIQASYVRRPRGSAAWRIFGGYTQRRRETESLTSGLVIDRVADGPVPDRVAAAIGGVERRWSLGARVGPVRRGSHTLHTGVEVEGINNRSSPSFVGTIGELVDGLQARVWNYATPPIDSTRHATTLAVFTSDRILLSPRLTLGLAVRVEVVRGRAVGAATGIAWNTLMPGAALRWTLGTPYDLALVSGYRRTANQLLLGLLAYGDPAAPTAEVFRWDDTLLTPGPLVARAGPGTGGSGAFSRIDPTMERPKTDEFVIGLESRPRPTLRLGVVGIARRQSSLINAVNTGASLSDYQALTIPDDNVDLVGTSDDHQLTIYNRLPASFGRDQFLLTNTAQPAATLGAVAITAQATTSRLFLAIGATASAALGSGGNRGFRTAENDQDVIGELLTNPNAATFARGRLFSDRAYVIKWTTVYQLPRAIRVGVIARYQDGQPFSRLVIVPGLNQGAEAVQAFANGRSRFAFTATLDARVQKGLQFRGLRLDAVVDVYNLLNMGKEVEEYVVTGPRFRETTAVQPPRAFHLGLRAAF